MVEAASPEAEEAEVAIVAKIVDEEEKDVDTTKLYEVLEVTKEATEAEIKKAFKKMTLLYHPDRPTGDEQKFKEVNAAYEVSQTLTKVLGNAEKRALYDKYGLEGVKSGGGMGGGMDDLFEMFGGGRRGGGGKKQKRKVQPTEKEISVTLEDIFSGKALKLDNDKQINCPDCNGKGGEGVNECGDCKGRGFVMKMQQLGPGMYTQSQAACGKCKGQGEVR